VFGCTTAFEALTRCWKSVLRDTLCWFKSRPFFLTPVPFPSPASFPLYQPGRVALPYIRLSPLHPNSCCLPLTKPSGAEQCRSAVWHRASNNIAYPANPQADYSGLVLLIEESIFPLKNIFAQHLNEFFFKLKTCDSV